MKREKESERPGQERDGESVSFQGCDRKKEERELAGERSAGQSRKTGCSLFTQDWL